MPTPSSDPLARLVEGSRELQRAFRAGVGGCDLARRRALLVDEVLVGIFEAAGLPRGWSLVALGGYGRGMLAPHSDVDLMILHSGRMTAAVGRVAERIFYPLWDAGIAVGNAVRTVKGAVDLASESLDTQTSLLDARLLAGDPALAADLDKRLIRQLRAGGGTRFFTGLAKALETRHREFGQSAYLMEPHIKEGLGGLRDIQSIAWVGKALLGAETIEALAGGGHVTSRDVAGLTEATDFLWNVRTRLHEAAARRDDRLTFDHQIALARELGYTDADEAKAAESFMRDVFARMGRVERISTVFWERQETRRRAYCAKREPAGDGLVVHNGHVDLADPSELVSRPSDVLALFAESVQRRVPVSASAIESVQEALPSLTPVRHWDDRTRDAFFGLLSSGPAALPTMELLTQMGVISHFIPEWEAVRSRVQFDAYHLWTVDLHSVHTVAELGRLRAGRHAADEPIATKIASNVSDWRPLLLAGLLHDLGKGSGGRHAASGARMARPILERIGLDEEDRRRVAYLISHHLLLYDTATRRDLDDERVIVRIAEDAATGERLNELYLLTVADALATGPKAWNPWKSALVGEIAGKALRMLERGEYTSPDKQRQVEETRAEVARLLTAKPARAGSGARRAASSAGRDGGPFSAASVAAFLDSMPYAYLLAFDAPDIARHFETAEAARLRGLATYARDGQRPGLYEFVLVTKEAADLFPTVAGALALNGVTIHSARTYVRDTGQALMTFTVADAFEERVPPAKWARVESDVAAALDGKIALVWRLAERASRYRRLAAPGPPKHPRVVVDNSASDFYTVIEVYAPDRVGLLFTITTALRELRLEIHQARISTASDEAFDVFYVLDRYGQKLSDPGQIREVSKAVTHALALSA